MKFGVREICNVVLKAKAPQQVGDKIFYEGEPVLYFDTLKTSSLEGAATTVYAQGGRGNARLVAWEGERTVTFTMEDALISPAGFSILSGAGLISGNKKALTVHKSERIKVKSASGTTFTVDATETPLATSKGDSFGFILMNGELSGRALKATSISGKTITFTTTTEAVSALKPNQSMIFIDYYYEDSNAGAMQIEITPDKFGGNYYLEASTLFRNSNGKDMPAEFVIPNCKIQSSFNFAMASTGDPSTFTFTMDAFPDYTYFDESKKVLAAIQVISDGDNAAQLKRPSTNSTDTVDINGNVTRPGAAAAAEIKETIKTGI